MIGGKKMRDFIDFIGWSGLTLASAVGFSQLGFVYNAGLDGPELMALGVCTSLAAGSGAYLLLCMLVTRVRSLPESVGHLFETVEGGVNRRLGRAVWKPADLFVGLGDAIRVFPERSRASFRF